VVEVRVYTRSFCSYCTLAKLLLQRRGIAFVEISCNGDDERRRWLVDQTGQRTLPQIFIGDVPIGGYTELARLDHEGRLLAVVAGEQPPPSVLSG
jgi:glutaredoxin 3